MELDLKASELEYNFLKDRVDGIKKHFHEICSKLSSYIDKQACVRDSGDEVAKSISSYASKENYNQTLRLAMGEFSDVLFSIQEYRDALVHRTLVKVIHEFDNYQPMCKQTKDDLKKCFEARNKELKKKNELEKARSKNPPKWQKIAQAEQEVNKAQNDAAHMTLELSNLVQRFERKKIEDLKHAFLEFVKIEMIFHCKAIELYTKAHDILKTIEVEDDLFEFCSHFKAHTSSLDIEDVSPSKRSAVPKTVGENSETAAQEHQAFIGVHRKPRSVFTMKTSTPNASQNLETFIDPIG